MTSNFLRHGLGIAGALLLLAGVCLHAQSPETPLNLDRGLDPGEEFDHGATAPVVEVEVEVLATFELSNGSTVSFLAVPEDGELGFSEMVPPGALSILSDRGDVRALDVFLALAPLDLPVPRALIELDTRKNVEELVVGRSRTDHLIEPVHILLDELGLEEAAIRNLVGASSYCDSAVKFASDLCRAEAGHNCGLIDYCDSGLWTSLIRSSYRGGWYKRQASFGWTATCGTAVEVRNLYWDNSQWKELPAVLVPSGYYYFVKYHGLQTYRRVIRACLSSGNFRAYTNFHNDC
jgi:hypothetical protein